MSGSCNLSRRDLLKAGAGMLSSSRALADVVSSHPANRFGTPGLYPARVVAIRHSSCSLDLQYQVGPIRQMIRSGVTALAGVPNYVAGWRQFVGPSDVVGIKVNPVGFFNIVSSPAVIMEIITGLMLAGVSPKNIIVYERYSGSLEWISWWLPSWVRTASATPGLYVDDQTDITGYDPNHYVDLPLFLDWQNPSNPAHRRSFAAQFVTQRVNKLINLAVLKNHNGAGVTLAMKNLSYGLTNNVNRSHPGTAANYYTTYIPAVVSMPVIRYKAVLHIVDGIHGLYEAGPYGDPAYIWEHKTMYFSTDAVAIDRIGWRVIDAKRVEMGMPVTALSTPYIGRPGLLQQPQYISSAAEAGLGECRDNYIDLRTTVLA